MSTTLRADRKLDQPPPGFVEVGVAPRLLLYAHKLWRCRDFIMFVPLGQLRAQTYNTLLGGFWHLLNPLMNAALYYLIFGVIFDARRDIPNYVGFLLVGLFTFVFTQRSTQAGASAVVRNANLLSQINFPRAALPISAVIAETISHTVAIGALMALLVVLGEQVTLRWAALPALLVLQALFNLGLAMIASRLAFHFRDIEALIPHVLRFWMYLSGLFYSAEFILERVGEDSIIAFLFVNNPAYIFMATARGLLVAGHAAPPNAWLHLVGWSVVTLVVGFSFFRAREVDYARV